VKKPPPLPPGLEIHDNTMGFTCVRLHYSALPERNVNNPDPKVAAGARAWLEMQRSQWPDPNDFEREFEISWYAGHGTRVFPQFTAHHHTQHIDYTPYKVIYRGWDFGWHTPVCLFAQIDRKDRLLVFKEIVGNQQTTSDFAKRVIERCAEWFPRHEAGFEDYCDPAGQQVKTVESERNERRDIEVLSGLGIHANYAWGWNRRDGRALIHQLLNLRSDGTPSLWVDNVGAALLAQAFLGRYVYPEKLDGTVMDEPDDKTHPWADVMAALRYLVIGLHPKLGVARAAFHRTTHFVSPPSDYMGYGTPRR